MLPVSRSIENDADIGAASTISPTWQRQLWLIAACKRLDRFHFLRSRRFQGPSCLKTDGSVGTESGPAGAAQPQPRPAAKDPSIAANVSRRSQTAPRTPYATAIPRFIVAAATAAATPRATEENSTALQPAPHHTPRHNWVMAKARAPATTAATALRKGDGLFARAATLRYRSSRLITYPGYIGLVVAAMLAARPLACRDVVRKPTNGS